MDDSTRSRLYGIAQTVLLFAYAAVGLFRSGPPLFTEPGLAPAATVLWIAGLLMIGAAFFSLRRVIQIEPEPKSGGHLITSGIYRCFRHPIYTGISLVVVGLFLRKPTLALAIGGAVVIAFLLLKTRFEEQLLTQRYPEYSEYRRRTWGVFPGQR